MLFILGGRQLGRRVHGFASMHGSTNRRQTDACASSISYGENNCKPKYYRQFEKFGINHACNYVVEVQLYIIFP